MDERDEEGQTALALLAAMPPCPAMLAAMRALLAAGADVAAKAADGVAVADGAYGDMKQLLIQLNKVKD